MKNKSPLLYALLYCLVVLLVAGGMSYISHGQQVSKNDALDVSDIEPTKAPTTILIPTKSGDQNNTDNETASLSNEDMSGSDPWSEVKGTEVSSASDMIGNRCLIIKKPEAEGDDLNISLTSDPMERLVQVTISGYSGGLLTSNDVARIALGTYYDGVPVLSVEEEGDPLREVTILSLGEAESAVMRLDLTLNAVYECRLYEDSVYYYIDLQTPQETGKKIIVLDAGHGGWDTGSYSEGYRYLEKDIALSIVNKLKALLEKNEHYLVYCTRTTDKRLTNEQRKSLINEVQADIFLSIHCSNDDDKAIQGVRIASSKEDFEMFAWNMLNKVSLAIDSPGIGVFVNEKEEPVLTDASIPEFIIEAAYLSNEEDLAKIIDPNTQQKITDALYQSIVNEMKDME